MSYMTNSLVACQTLQDDLSTLWQAEGSAGADEMMPLAEVLMSQANSRGIQQAMAPGNAKKPTVELKYTPRLTESEVEEDVDNPKCTATNKSGEFSQTYTMPDSNIGYSEVLDIEDFTEWCGDNGTRFLQRVNAIADVLERKVATQHAQEFALLAGTWGTNIFATGNAVGNVNSSGEYVWATRYSDGKPNPEAMGNLSIARKKAGLDTGVVGFGGTAAWTYFNALQIGCCADSGMDLMEAANQFALGYAYDKRLEAALGNNGSNKFMLYRLGSVVPLFYTNNQWKNGAAPIFQGGDYLHTSIFSPRTGMPMDLTIKDNCGALSIAVAVSTKLIAVPNDQFQTNDPYYGRNGVAKVLISNP